MTARPEQRVSLYDLDREELAARLAVWGFSAYHAGRLWAALYRHRDRDALAGLRPDLRVKLADQADLYLPEITVAVDSADGHTRKYLLRLADGGTVETVLMRFDGRETICVSSQVGCAMGCVFCATGQMGFGRHLRPGEIVGQVLAVMADRPAADLRNVVFMGMGEPLHNYDASLKAVAILTDARGLAIGPRYITISTVGLPDRIRRLADEPRPVNLAVSLHAATDAERGRLVPVNRRWPLEAILAACRDYTNKRRRRVFFEWALIAAENDGEDQARALGRLLQGLDAHVNLIPLNPTRGYDGRPAGHEAAARFQAILAEYGLPSTVRQRRGIDIDAGCGQLKTRHDLAPIAARPGPA
jgi:23S rRNA (adenine2503-C2)-methyltransferase